MFKSNLQNKGIAWILLTFTLICGFFKNFTENVTESRNLQKSRDIGKILSTRRQILERECKLLGVNKDISANWTWQPLPFNGKLELDKNHNYRVCVVPKGGSNAWIALRNNLIKEKLNTTEVVNILSVRHPFTRLASVYNDLFCHGELFNCCRENKMSRFDACLYGWWIPILISSGQLKINHAFAEAMKTIRAIKGSSGTVSMVNIPLHDAVKKSYSNYKQKILDEYKDVVVPFKDFINHIFWTYEHNIADHHWNPETAICDACRIPYSYIIHLENSKEEIQYILKSLGFQTIPEYKKKNVRRSNDTSQYTKYLHGLPRNITVKLFKYYKFDFNLIGYSL